MATCVTLIELTVTDWSIVQVSVKTAKFRSRGRQKIYNGVKDRGKCEYYY